MKVKPDCLTIITHNYHLSHNKLFLNETKSDAFQKGILVILEAGIEM